MAALSREATEIAAELDDPQATALAAAARRRAHWGPGRVERRLADSTLLLRAAREAGDLELTLQGHAWLVVDLLERGDRKGVEVQIEAFRAGAESLRQPLYLWNAAVWEAMRALLDGRLDEAEQLAAAAVSSGIRSEGVTAPQYFAVQLLYLRREQAGMGELEDAVREHGRPIPTGAGLARRRWPRCCYETGRPRRPAPSSSGSPATASAAIPRDGDWMVATALLADVAHALDDAERAAVLYDLLTPVADANVVIGLGAVCLGATSRYLGRLALTLGRACRPRWSTSPRALEASVALRRAAAARPLPAGSTRGRWGRGRGGGAARACRGRRGRAPAAAPGAARRQAGASRWSG